MHNKRLWAGVVVVLLPCLGCYQVLEAIRRPTVRAVRPRITGVNLQKLALAFDVDVENPYPFDLPSPRFRYGLDIEGAEFLQAQEAAAAKLPASDVGTVTLPVELSYAHLISTYQKLAGANEVAYKLHGALLVSALGKEHELPLSHSGRLPVLRPPKFSNIKVDFSDVSLTRAKVTARADIHNPNIFALGVKGLGYALQLGEVPVGKLAASTADSIAAGQAGGLELTGEISAASALVRLLGGRGLGLPKIAPTGAFDTPYGTVKLQE